MNKRIYELVVGVFILVGFLALLELAFSVSGLKLVDKDDYYQVSALFDNIGSLKPHAVVSLAGVEVGQVASITLDPVSLQAKVSLLINKKFNQLPVDTAASIFTRGLLGDNYISLTPGFEKANLKPGGQITTTHSALVLESLIGEFLYGKALPPVGDQAPPPEGDHKSPLKDNPK